MGGEIVHELSGGVLRAAVGMKDTVRGEVVLRRAMSRAVTTSPGVTGSDSASPGGCG